MLKVISSSAGELRRVFETMLENAVRICWAEFGNLWLREGDVFRMARRTARRKRMLIISAENRRFVPIQGLGSGRF